MNSNNQIEVVLSVRPRWLKLIFARQKVIELRKSAPKLPEGQNTFRIYFYETHSAGGCGAVVGEAECFFVEKAKQPFNAMLSERSCVDLDVLSEYAGRRPVYGWYLAKVVKYAEPRPLHAFGIFAPPQSWRYVKKAT